MTHQQISMLAGTAGLVLFFLFFVGVLFWIFRPGSKQTYNGAAQIPLQDDRPRTTPREG